MIFVASLLICGQGIYRNKWTFSCFPYVTKLVDTKFYKFVIKFIQDIVASTSIHLYTKLVIYQKSMLIKIFTLRDYWW